MMPTARVLASVVDQLTARGVMEAPALYDPPFSNLQAGGESVTTAALETQTQATTGLYSTSLNTLCDPAQYRQIDHRAAKLKCSPNANVVSEEDRDIHATIETHRRL